VKSSINELKSRGFVDKSQINYDVSVPSLKNLLASETPEKRTLAAIIIQEKNISRLIPDLISAVKIEKKLYSKIAISEALISFKEKSIEKLIPLLGQIGNNQHQKLPTKPFKKDNYPLPRDIIARILSQMGVYVIFLLLTEAEKMSRNQLLEAIDLMGNISYYSKNSESLKFLLNLFEKNKNDELMTWKIIRAFSSFSEAKIVKILEKIINNSKIEQHVWEAKRSLRLIKKRNKDKAI
jgi:hypothetical protein